MRPGPPEQYDLLFQSYFGGNGTDLDRFISRAYRDWNRTFRGIGKIGSDAERNAVLSNAKALLVRHFQKLRDLPTSGNSDSDCTAFDLWHDACCKALIRYYGRALPDLCEPHMKYGQAQKWINMSMKYCWLFGGRDLDWLASWYPVAHVPVDEVVLQAAKKKQVVVERPCRAWSQWDNATTYRAFQSHVRDEASRRKISPLELEFEWWNVYRPMAKGRGS